MVTVNEVKDNSVLRKTAEVFADLYLDLKLEKWFDAEYNKPETKNMVADLIDAQHIFLWQERQLEILAGRKPNGYDEVLPWLIDRPWNI